MQRKDLTELIKQVSVTAREPFILGINGGIGTTGTHVNILKQSLYQASADGCHTQRIHLCDYITGSFDGKLDGPMGGNLEMLREILEKADGIIISQPIYWSSPTSILKIFIEEITKLETEGFKLEGKVLGLIAVGNDDGGMATNLSVAGPLIHMGMIIPPYCLYYYIKRAADRSEHDWMNKDIKLVGHNVALMAKQNILCHAPHMWSYETMAK